MKYALSWSFVQCYPKLDISWNFNQKDTKMNRSDGSTCVWRKILINSERKNWNAAHSSWLHLNKYQAKESGLSTFYDAAKNYVGNKTEPNVISFDRLSIISSHSREPFVNVPSIMFQWKFVSNFYDFAFLVSSKKKK